MTDSKPAFKPWYVWPNTAFHFGVWYESPNCRIFLIENISHNWDWLSRYRDRIKDNDYFFVQLGWHFHYHFVKHTQDCIDALGLDRSRFRIMYPDFAALTYFTAAGFEGKLVNHNCFLDYDIVKPMPTKKIYDAIYVARFAPFKRHYLACDVGRLALVAGSAWGVESEEIPKHDYLNGSPLGMNEVLEKISESKTGLILSEAEGACYSSSEYLLCGIPVISTHSHGGRDVWYNEINSIIVDPHPQSVAEAVSKMININPSSHLIRELHIVQSEIFRANFISMFQEICCLAGDSRFDCKSYFAENFAHKLLRSQSPDFDKIFPP